MEFKSECYNNQNNNVLLIASCMAYCQIGIQLMRAQSSVRNLQHLRSGRVADKGRREPLLELYQPRDHDPRVLYSCTAPRINWLFVTVQCGFGCFQFLPCIAMVVCVHNMANIVWTIIIGHNVRFPMFHF